MSTLSEFIVVLSSLVHYMQSKNCCKYSPCKSLTDYSRLCLSHGIWELQTSVQLYQLLITIVVVFLRNGHSSQCYGEKCHQKKPSLLSNGATEPKIDSMAEISYISFSV